MKQYLDTLYYVSETGDVLRNGKKLKTSLTTNGYENLTIRINGKVKNHLIHRLVAILFIENPNDLPQVNHIDGNKLNNCVDNLEWITSSNNHRHRIDVLGKGRGENNNSSKLTDIDILCIRKNYICGCVENGQRALAKRFNVKQSTINYIIHNKGWKHLL